MAIRNEPQNEVEEVILNLSMVIGKAIIKEFPRPHNMDIIDTFPDHITIQFEDHRRKLSRTQTALRRIIYTTRNINKINSPNDVIDLVAHECSHFAYPNHSREFWSVYNRSKNSLECMLRDQ